LKSHYNLFGFVREVTVVITFCHYIVYDVSDELAVSIFNGKKNPSMENSYYLSEMEIRALNVSTTVRNEGCRLVTPCGSSKNQCFGGT
jgi:hypothetical protein